MIAEVTSADELKSILEKAGNKLVVLDFFATWCGPCKMISPKIEELSKEMVDVMFVKIDVDELSNVAAQYEIISLPTFVFIKGGEVLDSFSGSNYETLKTTVQKHK